MKKKNKYIWTSELEQKLKEIYPTTLTQSIADDFKMSIYAIRNKAWSLGLKKDIEWIRDNSRYNMQFNEGAKRNQIKKGSVPHNKGKKINKEVYEKMKHTFFKKGNVPANAKKDFEEVQRRDSSGKVYWMIKLPGNKKLLFKHVWIWETTNGKISKGQNIVFKNGNSLDCQLDNLECISNAELMRRNTIQRYPADIKQAIRLNSKLKKQLKDITDE
ncbi:MULTISPECIES: HNH endonuclease signature motif containing protein [unclassified Myroides]|uniref:HNH endonuclease signature motif containing protein n=1 Tax=unclassified Myroides TaxID=2642485 RepID=UPI003D2F9110